MENKKIEFKKAFRRALEIKTILFIIAVYISLFYYASCYMKNEVLVFKKDSLVILLALFVMILWICCFCLFLLYENRKLLKIIIKKDETIETLLNQLITKTDNIEQQNKEVIENTEAIMEQNEDNFDQVMKSNKNVKEILFDRSDMVE